MLNAFYRLLAIGLAVSVCFGRFRHRLGEPVFIILLITLVFVPLLSWADPQDPDLVYSQRPEPYGKSLCEQPEFKCIIVQPGNTWKKKFPDPHRRDLVQRLNRTNIPLRYRRWLIVPKQWDHLNYLRLGPFAEQIDPPEQPLLLVDLRVFAFAAYDAQGHLLNWGPASGGDQWCPDSSKSCVTAAGRYHIYRIQGIDCTSTEFPAETRSGIKGGARMPYCMHYYKGYAIHGDSMIGFTHRSHGCIHVMVSDAKWLATQFAQVGATVIVKR